MPIHEAFVNILDLPGHIFTRGEDIPVGDGDDVQCP